MWAERFVIIVSSLSRDFLPSSWHFYSPTWVDWSILFGSVSFFFLLFFLFLRFVPMVAISEIKADRHEAAAAASAVAAA
jgi:molybdopterin-containing oxidoreductase family membrane subunit